MKILTRYLLRQLFTPFVFTFLALTGVILINTLAKELASLAGRGLPLSTIGEFFLLSLPANVALTFPMAVLVAVLYAFSRMATDGEISALKASGVDLRRMSTPVITASLLLTGAMILFNDRVLPAANYRWRTLMLDVAQTSPLLALREQVLNPIPSADSRVRQYIQAERIDPARSVLQKVAILDMSDPLAQRTMYADSGTVSYINQGADLLLVLHHGSVRSLEFAQPAQLTLARFERQLLRLPGVGRPMERSVGALERSERDMTIQMMHARIEATQEKIRTLGPAEAGSAREQFLQREVRGYRVEIHKKFAIASAAFVFVLIGLPFALRFPRGGIGMTIGISLATFAVYYVGLIGGESLADAGHLSPTIAMWATNLIFGSVGLISFFYLGRERGSLRGR